MGKKSKRQVIFLGKDSLVDIYQFMSRCGLECPFNSNIRISHKIMEKKLLKRFELFPGKIVLPERVDYKRVNDEDLANGYYLAVRDDYNKVIIYKNPRRKTMNDLLEELRKTNDRKKLEKVRDVILEELGYEQSVSGEITKKIENVPMEHDDYDITENVNRNVDFVDSGNGHVKIRHKY